jgi:oxygen-independent coproporphyrinogen-3 oxidase
VLRGEFGTVRCMLNSPDEQIPVLTEEMLRRLDRPGPRYTSYPTADRFVEAFGPEEYRQALEQRESGANVGGKPPLSIYVHIPFCESVCYYCACNKVITRHHERAAEYLDVLEQEIALHAAVLESELGVSQLHLGGGTPTHLAPVLLARILDRVLVRIPGTEHPERSVEVDPRVTTDEHLQLLHERGF